METKEKEQVFAEIVSSREKVLVLHNDDYNTFDHVIECLIAVCKHQPTQAEQCAYIVHYNGKCTVKKGALDQLKPMYNELKLMNLTVEIK